MGPNLSSAQHEFMAQTQSKAHVQQAQQPQTTVGAHQAQSQTLLSTSSSRSAQNPTNVHMIETNSKKGIAKPNTKYTLAMTLAKSSSHEPRTPQQALRDEKWCHAMSEEYNAQTSNHIWDLVPPPSPQVNIVGCKTIFTTKYNLDGTIRRCKARLVAKGYNQQHGLDYSEIFSPVWPIRQLDVNNAFLQGTMKENVYMVQPPRFVDSDRPEYVCHLKKALYGLKQAPHAWYLELRNFLLSVGFQNSIADTSLFILKREKSFIYMLIYVDDILVTGNDNELMKQTLDMLANRFSVKDHEELSYVLGIEAKRTSSSLHLTQRRYILDLLERTNMLSANTVSTPMVSSPKLTLHSCTPLTDATECRCIVGSLQYLAFTRPDISYDTNRLSQFMHSPTDAHWQAVKRVLRYLAATPSYDIFLSRRNSPTLHAFSDSDWAGDNDDYVSTNGYIVYLGT